MVYELADRGEQPVVIDDFSSGFKWAIPSGVPVFVEDIGDQRRVAPLIAKYGISEIIHLRLLSLFRSRLPNRFDIIATTPQFPKPVRDRNQEWSAAFHLLVDGCGVRESAGKSCHGKDPVAPVSPYGSSKFMAETMLRDAARAHGLPTSF